MSPVLVVEDVSYHITISVIQLVNSLCNFCNWVIIYPFLSIEVLHRLNDMMGVYIEINTSFIIIEFNHLF